MLANLCRTDAVIGCNIYDVITVMWHHASNHGVRQIMLPGLFSDATSGRLFTGSLALVTLLVDRGNAGGNLRATVGYRTHLQREGLNNVDRW